MHIKWTDLAHMDPNPFICIWFQCAIIHPQISLEDWAPMKSSRSSSVHMGQCTAISNLYKAWPFPADIDKYPTKMLLPYHVKLNFLWGPLFSQCIIGSNPHRISLSSIWWIHMHKLFFMMIDENTFYELCEWMYSGQSQLSINIISMSGIQ